MMLEMNEIIMYPHIILVNVIINSVKKGKHTCYFVTYGR
jgi:hypothetical protein